MRNLIISTIIILSIVALLQSCNNSNKEKNKDVFIPLRMVEVPAMITEPGERDKYIIEHFWDMMNFGDTSYLSNIQNLNVHFSAYLDYLTTTTAEGAKRSVVKLTDSILNGNPKIISKFKTMFETAFYEPNSLYRNEELYICVLEEFLNSGKISDAEKIQMKYQLDLANRNHLGTKAIDFNFVLADGSFMNLYGIRSEFTLLMFFDPDCPACKSVMDEIKSSPTLSGLSSKVKVLTMYAGVDFERWMVEAPNLNKSWINGCDKEMKISEGSLYDLRPTPALYLLDRQKTVILKDAPFKFIEEYLKKI
ncbi:MAG: DUF5106 domain-containing protein [Rikenellaceae bacterium]